MLPPLISSGGTRTPSVAGPSVPGQKEHWDMLRGAVVHEDNLVNHRLTWLLTAQGFTLAFFAVMQSVALSDKTPVGIGIGLEAFLACALVFAILLCRVVGFSVAMANLHNNQLLEWWTTRYPDERRASVLPEHLPQDPPPSDRAAPALRRARFRSCCRT